MTDTNYIAMSEGYQEVWCAEFYHPDSTIDRLVADNVNHTLTLESDAPNDPSTAQVFAASSILINPPGQRKDGDTRATIDFGSIGNAILDKYEALPTTAITKAYKVVIRAYNIYDTSSPTYILKGDISGFGLSGHNSSVITIEDVDFANKPSGENITLLDWPCSEGVS